MSQVGHSAASAAVAAAVRRIVGNLAMEASEAMELAMKVAATVKKIVWRHPMQSLEATELATE